MKNKSKSLVLLIIISILALIISTSLFSQVVEKQNLTRGKMWFCGNPNGSLERENTMGYNWQLAYPGHWDNRNEASGGWDNTLVYNIGQVAGQDAGWYYRNGPFDDPDIYAVVQSSLVKNYNLVDPNQPEEYITGTIGSYKTVDNLNHMAYELEGKVMAWSHPKYDDFILIKCKLTNTDDAPIENYYYSRYMRMNGPYRPDNVSYGYDVEYLWDTAVSADIGFIFYDDTSIPYDGSTPPVYTIPPGDVSGDAGDPGNIGTEGSVDFKLYSPNLYADSFIPSSLTPNKNGEQKVWRNIVSQTSSAPVEELWPGTWDQMTQFSIVTDFINNNPQPEVSWRDANATYQPGDKAGSLYERDARYLYSIGPYDIAPGESIEWVEILLAGAMDRNITIKGGADATANFVAEGLKNLKDNWAAAQVLIANDYKIPTGELPPPTPADAPRVGNSNELLVDPASATIDGNLASGVNLTWDAVHVGYTDPQTGSADFAGYKVYRSDISVEGPWQLISTVTKAEADPLVQGGRVTFFAEAYVGVPYRYCVTSFDTDGNESGKSGHSHYPVSASFQASNDLNAVQVVPNPFRQHSGFSDTGEEKRLAFINIPAKCTIRIYTVALDLVRTIEHDDLGGLETWGSSEGKDYMLTDFAMNVMPGVYIYHVESHVNGHDGETSVGKFVIIK